MSVEYELKYKVTEAQWAALAADFPGDPRICRMHTRYYDTPERCLSRRKLTLRLRMENDIPVCTLKTPEKAGGRGEYEVSAPDIREALPELCKLAGLTELLPLLGDLREVCGARFTRQAVDVVLPQLTVEMALDRGVLTGGGREQALLEAEFELKSGSWEELRIFGLLLEKRLGLIPEGKSKFRRALDLAEGV